jgi:hypothetical protein
MATVRLRKHRRRIRAKGVRQASHVFLAALPPAKLGTSKCICAPVPAIGPLCDLYTLSRNESLPTRLRQSADRRCASKFVVSHPCRKTPARMGHPQTGCTSLRGTPILLS